MNNKECVQALEKALEKVEDIKEDVSAFIVLAVTDEESLDGTAKTGVNAVCGQGDDLLNLLANLPDELVLKVSMAKTLKGLETLLTEEKHDKKVH